VSDYGIPLEPVEDPVREHFVAAENYLAIAEEGFQRLYEEPPAVIREDTFRGTNAKMRTALQLAEQYREMAVAIWNTTPQRVAVSTDPPSAADIEAMKQALAEKIDPPCACCTSGLFIPSSQDRETCADCGHAGDRHNGNAPARPPFALTAYPESRDALRMWVRARTATELDDLLDEVMAARKLTARRDAAASKSWKSGGGAGQWNG
jgi:hypothetical protein